MQASRPIYVSNCALYSVKAFQIKSADGWYDSYVSFGVRLPDGTYDRPAHLKQFYWTLPGECASGSMTVCTIRKIIFEQIHKKQRDELLSSVHSQ